MTDLSDDQIDVLLVHLSSEGFGLPFMARGSDYATPEDYKAADNEAWAENRTALRAAIQAADL